MRALVLVISTLAAVLVLAAAEPVSAQSDDAPRLEARAALILDAELDRELASIDAESQAATALYVSGLVLHVGGIATMVGTGIAGICISFSSSCESERSLASTGLLIGGIAAALGAVGIFVGVGLDVDSGNRRRDHAARRTLLFGVGPSADGSSLSLRGTF